MGVNYDKLWQRLKDNKMTKEQLKEAAHISQNTISKLNNRKTVAMDTMIRLCKIFHCDIGDLMEVIEEL